MIPVVFDANVVISGCGWLRGAHRCLLMVARRELRSFVTADMVDEWKRTMTLLDREHVRFARDPWPALHWLIERSIMVEPAPLGKPRSRDPKDDPYLACALAAGVEYIVSHDRDLLALQKPFGIRILEPAEMLNVLHRHRRT